MYSLSLPLTESDVFVAGSLGVVCASSPNSLSSRHWSTATPSMAMLTRCTMETGSEASRWDYARC